MGLPGVCTMAGLRISRPGFRPGSGPDLLGHLSGSGPSSGTFSSRGSHGNRAQGCQGRDSRTLHELIALLLWSLLLCLSFTSAGPAVALMPPVNKPGGLRALEMLQEESRGRHAQGRGIGTSLCVSKYPCAQLAHLFGGPVSEALSLWRACPVAPVSLAVNEITAQGEEGRRN